MLLVATKYRFEKIKLETIYQVHKYNKQSLKQRRYIGFICSRIITLNACNVTFNEDKTV